jgi:hypothetical protein
VGLQGTTQAVQNCADSASPVPVAEASAQGAAGAAAANGWQTITLGLQESSGNERDPNLWKKFDATSAVLVVPFDRYPDKPDQLSTDNKACGGWVSSATPTMRAHINDADTSPISARFFWATANSDGTYTQLGWGNQDNVPSNTTSQFTIPASANLVDGGSYAWQIQVWDAFVWGPVSDWCTFHLDLVPPDAPKAVTSSDYPDDGQYHGGLGQAGTFVFTPPDSHPEDVAFYQYRTVDDSRAAVTVSAAADHSATVVITPDWTGQATLKVWTEDKAGNVSATWFSYTITVAGATGPVGRWAFDEGTGTTAADSSGTNPASPLHLTGAAGWAAHDRYGTALSLDGSTGEAETASPVLHTNANFTVAAWVRLSTTSTNQWVTAVSQNGSQQSSFVLSYNSSAWAFALHSADAASGVTAWRVAAPGTVQAGVWTHLAGVYDAGSHEMRLYVNGALAATGEGANPFDSRSTLDVGRARTNNSWTDWWPGQVDDVQVWDRIVYPGEIAAIANKPIPVGQWDLNDNTGSTAADATSPPHPLALTATSWVSAGHSGSALHLNGSTSYGETTGPVLHTNTSFTVMAWVRLTSTNTNGNWATAVSQNAGQSSSFVLSYNGSEWAFALHSPDNASPTRWRIAAPSTVQVQTGVWTHLAGVYDAGTHQMRLYVDGHLVASGEGANPFDAQSTLDVGKARTAGAWTDWWPGDIDQVRIWTGVLSDTQIRQQAHL